MYAAKWSMRRPVFQLLVLGVVVWLLSACGASALGGANWPGLSADSTTVYVADGPEVRAIDVANQKELWKFPTERGRAIFLAPPGVGGSRIVIGNYGVPRGMFSPSVVVTLYGLEVVTENGQATPATLWTQENIATDRIIAAPLVTAEQVFVGTADNHLLALNAADGALQWEYEMGHSLWAQPTLADDMLFASSMDRTIYAFQPETGELIWEKTLDGAIAAKPLVADGVVYVSSFDKQLHALDARTGAEIWSADGGDWIWSAPAVDADHVYFVDADGQVIAVQRATGAPVWTAQTAGPVQASALVRDGVVYVASQGDGVNGQLLALAADTGATLWETQTPAPVFATPVIVGDTLVAVVQSEGSLLIFYNVTDGTQRWVFTPTTE